MRVFEGVAGGAVGMDYLRGEKLKDALGGVTACRWYWQSFYWSSFQTS